VIGVNFIETGTSLNERKSITLDIDGESRALYILLRWQRQTRQWTMGVQDEEGNDLITHIPLLGTIGGYSSNILRAYAYKELGKAGVLPLDAEVVGVDPDDKTLSEKYTLVWGD